MKAGTRRSIQVFLALALFVSGARLAWIYYQRRHAQLPPRLKTSAPAGRVHPDFLVYLPRVHLTDLKSAQKLKGTHVWVRDGYRYAHYPYDALARRTREIADPPVLPPIHKITINDIVTEPSKRAGVKEVSLVFEMPAVSPSLRALTVGYCQSKTGDCRFHVDDMFFLKDPRELYTHWTGDDWRAIERGEARIGMSEAQVSFAIGFGSPLSPVSAEIAGDRVVQFRPPGRPPVTVTFGADGKARRIE